MKNTKTEMIKSKFSNAVHKIINPNNVKTTEQWKAMRYITAEQKIQMFDQIVTLDNDTSMELRCYWFNRGEKRRIQKARIARGVKTKIKTSKAQYEAMKEKV